LEALGQQPLQLGIDIGAKGQSTAGANALLMGGNAAAATQARADTFNPFATALTMGSQNPALAAGLGNLFGGGARAGFSQTGLGGAGFGTGLAYGNQDLGAFI
jgi:hypothetical protein